MRRRVASVTLALAGLLACAAPRAAAQDLVPVLTFRTDAAGVPLLTVASTPDDYFVVEARSPGRADWLARSVTRGQPDSTVLTEPAGGLAADAYRVRRFRVSAPGDLDGDGRDDLAELAGGTRLGPLNPAMPVELADGAVRLVTATDFDALAASTASVDSTLAGGSFVKFYLVDNRSDASLEVYFVNVRNLPTHLDFARAVGIPTQPNGVSLVEDMRGTLVYHPEVEGPSGQPGLYTFEFGALAEYDFALIRRAFDGLTANMPFLRGRLAYRPQHPRAFELLEAERAAYAASRIPVVTEDELFGGLDYLAVNAGVGFGRLRVLPEGETPSPFDVVVLETLPNELPRVGGILTSVVQTPLSHVNLRAIENGLPNAYLRDATADARVADLLGGFVRLEVRADGFELRAATQAEVDDYFADQRPREPQRLRADLAVREIRPLRELGFADAVSVGAKAANLAELHRLGFPAGTVPEGFAVPFAFYAAFMRHNGLDARVRELLADPAFRDGDSAAQEAALDALRDGIRDGTFPADLDEALTRLQASFPVGTYIRCRSSTNNEDLPGFSGAGLYDSKTQRPDEGHIRKSIRQVFASLWNYRAYVEREFFRVEHETAYMAVLVHPSFREERVNGVAVSTDPLFGEPDVYYVTSQIGEDLVTNPASRSVSEELLVGSAPGGRVQVVRTSNRVLLGERVLEAAYLEQLRGYLGRIDAHFAELYDAAGEPSFAVEVEFKVDSSGQLAIKQARPWVGYEPQPDGGGSPLADAPAGYVFPNPVAPGQDAVLVLELDTERTLSVHLADALGRQLGRPLVAPFPTGRGLLSLFEVAAAPRELERIAYAVRDVDSGELLWSGWIMRR